MRRASAAYRSSIRPYDGSVTLSRRVARTDYKLVRMDYGLSTTFTMPSSFFWKRS
jgi:hypothetical protein